MSKVVIAGGGPAGIIAGIACARNGAQVLLLEASGCLGGMLTSGLLSFWGSFDDMDRRLDWEVDRRLFSDDREIAGKMDDLPVARRIVRGIPEELLKRLVAGGGAMDLGTGCIPVNPETFKRISEAMVLESGAEILYYTQVVDVVMTGTRIKAVKTASKAGLQEIDADIFIDASGDGDLAASSGVPFEVGRPEDGQVQGVTLVFRLGGVAFHGRGYADMEEVQRCNGIFGQALTEGKVSGAYTVGCINSIPGLEGVVAVNTQHTAGINGTRPEDLTRAMINGRREINEIVALFKQHLRGFENCFLLDTASFLGVRESRRIVGEYTLTAEDVIKARQFADSIGKGAWALDCHLAPLESEHYTEEDIFMKGGTCYDIPYRCLVPKVVDNLLVAGRCVSATHRALGALRIMPQCMVMGQAAGTAAALCLKSGRQPREVDVPALQTLLQRDGAYI